MNIYHMLIMGTFIIVAIILIAQYFDNNTPKLIDILTIASTIPCYEIVVYRNGKRLRYEAWISYINNSVKYTEFNDGVLYVTIS